MHSRHKRLTLAIHCLLLSVAAGTAHAEAQSDPRAATRLDSIEVKALAIAEDTDQVASPYSLMSREEITLRGAGTLGEVLGHLPGVNVDTFGGGASRPVIRGQTAPRVKVLSDGASLLDASDISPDHTVTVDPLLTPRIEVLRGPATLLYGSGAVGGVVNVLDNKIPTALPENGVEGSAVLRGNTVANERAGAAEVTFGIGSRLALHAEGSIRDADDYRVPDWEESRVDGSFAESRNASVGVSWLFDRGYVGLAYSYRDDDYGLPGHSHAYEDCHPHGSSLHCGSHEHGDGEEHEHGHEHGEIPVIDLLSKRVDLRAEVLDPFAGFERLRVRLSDTRYRHHELEEDEIGTTFRNDGHEARIELQHLPWGRWSGVFGLQHADTRFSADGAEAFLPTVDTRSTALFLVEHIQASEAWHIELGARHESLEHTPVNDARNRPVFDDSATSLSAAAIWQFADGMAFTVSTARSERLPHAQELYARGVHLATNTYECGLLPHPLTCGGAANNQAIDTETFRNFELGLRKTEGPFTFSLSAFQNAVDNYIHARTLDRFEDFRLIKYTQRDAEFRGIEAEATFAFTDQLSATVFGDRVHAEFADGSGRLPRIPAARLGTRLASSWGDLSSELEFYRVFSQNRIADYETETPGYTQLNLSLSYVIGADKRTRVFLRGSNLLDDQAWNHSSFLASVVPLPGRNLTAGLRYDF